VYPAYRSYYYSGFIQDDWKVSSRLTLNLGFRWDYEAPMAERYNRMVRGFDFNMASPIAGQVQGLSLKGGLLYAGTSGEARQAFNRDYKHPQPRGGFAYKVNDKTVLRGGYGLFFLGQYEMGPATGYSQQTPLVSSVDGGLTPAVTLSNPFPNGLLKPIGNSLGPATNLGLAINAQYVQRPLPYSQQWSFGFERELPGHWTLDTSYSGNFTNRLPVSGNADALPASQLFQASSFYTTQVPNPMAGLLPNNAALNGATIARQQLLLPYPQYTGINLTSIPIGKQWYHGWQSRVAKRFSSGFTLQGTYAISKAIEAVSLLNPQDFALTDINRSVLERRLLQYDTPQKLTLLGTYEFPLGRGRRFGTGMHPVLNAVTGGWQVNGNLTLQRGFIAPFPNAAPVTARSAELPTDQRSLYHWFDTSLWREPTTGQVVPTQAPFTLRTFPTEFPDVRTQGLRNVDISLFKNFQIYERVRLNFRAECYNISNTPWFTNLNTTSVTDPTFGSLALSSANGPRRITMGLRLLW
jgi:hypothetical protein